MQHNPCPLCGNLVCQHTGITEAGKRMANIVNNVRTSHDWDDVKNGWMAFKLEDGSCDGTIYDNKNDAVWYLRNKADKYFYLSLRQCMHGMTENEATRVLAMTRVQSDRGRYHPVPDDMRDPINPITMEDFRREAEIVVTQGVPWMVPGMEKRFG